MKEDVALILHVKWTIATLNPPCFCLRRPGFLYQWWQYGIDAERPNEQRVDSAAA